jgi:L-2-hydroxyglutarate oxidase LhgO
VAGKRIGVIGAGIVGLSTARWLQQRGDVEVTVLDKESDVAVHQTGRNSNVVHSGVYYPPGSLKSTLCRRGVELIKDYCAERELPYEELGKVIVAVRPDELPRLQGLSERAAEVGLPARLIDPAELRDREPHVVGLSALLIPSTAVVDYKLISRAFADDITAAGGQVLLGRPVIAINQRADQVTVTTPTEELSFDHVVVCAGLQSSIVAELVGVGGDLEIIPFRGEYYELTHDTTHLIRGLVYPVPDPRYPFLGVHFTRGIGEHVHVGPNAVLALAQEGYTRSKLSAADLRRIATFRGTWSLARQHWRMGATEVAGSLSKTVFTRRCREYVQAVRRDGSLVDDFVIDRRDRLTLVRNAPSPAATASLAIGEKIAAGIEA